MTTLALGRLAVGMLLLGSVTMAQDKATTLLEVCDLIQNPSQNVGRMVRVRGQVSSGWAKPEKVIQSFTIGQLASSTRCIGRISIVLPSYVKPEPSFMLLQDDAFRALESALHSSMSIDATFEGEFRAAKVRAGRPVLVLSKVSDVDAHVLYRK